MVLLDLHRGIYQLDNNNHSLRVSGCVLTAREKRFTFHERRILDRLGTLVVIR